MVLLCGGVRCAGVFEMIDFYYCWAWLCGLEVFLTCVHHNSCDRIERSEYHVKDSKMAKSQGIRHRVFMDHVFSIDRKVDVCVEASIEQASGVCVAEGSECTGDSNHGPSVHTVGDCVDESIDTLMIVLMIPADTRLDCVDESSEHRW